MEVRSQQGKTLCLLLFPHRWVCGKESPHRVPKASHGGFGRHKAHCHAAVLVPRRSAREGAFLWMHGDTSLRHSRVAGCLLIRKLLQDLSCPPQGWGWGSQHPRESRLHFVLPPKSRRLSLFKSSLSLNLIPEALANLFLFRTSLTRWRQGLWHSHLRGAVQPPSKRWQVTVTQADPLPCVA